MTRPAPRQHRRWRTAAPGCSVPRPPRHPPRHTPFYNRSVTIALKLTHDERLAMPKLSDAHKVLPRTILPSTSPAHAGMPFDRKLARWREIVLPLIATT